MPSIRITRIASLFATALYLCGGCARAPRREQWLLSYDGSYGRTVASDSFFVRAFSGPPDSECKHGLFSGVIFLGVQAAPSGRWFAAWANPHRPVDDATVDDWFRYVNSLTGRTGPLARLESAMSRTNRGPIDVAIMVPAMVRDTGMAMRIGGQAVDVFAASGALVYAAYIDSLQSSFNRGGFTHLRLRAAYWLQEQAWGPDGDIAPRVASIVHSHDLQFLWIPYWGAGRAREWKALGFDAAWQQPNYFFHANLTHARLDSAEAFAKTAGMGLEIELDGRALTDSSARRRLEEYVNVVQREKAMAIAVYDGGGVIARLFADRSPVLASTSRRLAAALCR